MSGLPIVMSTWDASQDVVLTSEMRRDPRKSTGRGNRKSGD